MFFPFIKSVGLWTYQVVQLGPPKKQAKKQNPAVTAKKMQEDGTLLADVAGSFVKKFESYALQRSMGQQLIEYAFPARSNFWKSRGAPGDEC